VLLDYAAKVQRKVLRCFPMPLNSFVTAVQSFAPMLKKRRALPHIGGVRLDLVFL
jgi:hypothetical protein